jgi:hypothetical protein
LLIDGSLSRSLLTPLSIRQIWGSTALLLLSRSLLLLDGSLSRSLLTPLSVPQIWRSTALAKAICRKLRWEMKQRRSQLGGRRSPPASLPPHPLPNTSMLHMSIPQERGRGRGGGGGLRGGPRPLTGISALGRSYTPLPRRTAITSQVFFLM